MDVLAIIKIICLFLAVRFTLINGTKFSRGQTISSQNFIWQAIGITGFVVLQFKMYM